jgi:hypothetical protein
MLECKFEMGRNLPVGAVSATLDMRRAKRLMTANDFILYQKVWWWFNKCVKVVVIWLIILEGWLIFLVVELIGEEEVWFEKFLDVNSWTTYTYIFLNAALP